ncbi:hypothetical protein ACKKBG_A24880 [Auxenochlorella protothecoides x Auxenochlorella symbiontica]
MWDSRFKLSSGLVLLLALTSSCASADVHVQQADADSVQDLPAPGRVIVVVRSSFLSRVDDPQRPSLAQLLGWRSAHLRQKLFYGDSDETGPEGQTHHHHREAYAFLPGVVTPLEVADASAIKAADASSSVSTSAVGAGSAGAMPARPFLLGRAAAGAHGMLDRTEDGAELFKVDPVPANGSIRRDGGDDDDIDGRKDEEEGEHARKRKHAWKHAQRVAVEGEASGASSASGRMEGAEHQRHKCRHQRGARVGAEQGAEGESLAGEHPHDRHRHHGERRDGEPHRHGHGHESGRRPCLVGCAMHLFRSVVFGAPNHPMPHRQGEEGGPMWAGAVMSHMVHKKGDGMPDMHPPRPRCPPPHILALGMAAVAGVFACALVMVIRRVRNACALTPQPQFIVPGAAGKGVVYAAAHAAHGYEALPSKGDSV